MAGLDGEAVIADIWNTFVSHSGRSRHPEMPLFPEGGSGFAPDGYRAGDPIHDYTAEVMGPGGPRRLRVLFECIFPDLAPPAVLDEAAVRTVIEEISAY